MSFRPAARYAALLVVAAGVAAALWYATRPPPPVLQGEVVATRVDLAARVTGRVGAIAVDVGDVVEAPGRVVVELESPQLLASLAAAEAALAVAAADRDRVYSTRPEVIDARRAEVARAEADVVLHRGILERQTALLQRANTSRQAVDEAKNHYEAALRAKAAAEANLALAVNGSSPEEKALADARVRQAEAAVRQARTDVAELTIRAPIAGEVTTRVAETGALFSPGAPLMSIVDLGDPWFSFNVREDLLAGVEVGKGYVVRVPALGGRDVPVRVTAINAQGEYATWRATKATGDFDLRTFEVRARPAERVEGLRPGMSGLVTVAGPAAPAAAGRR
jgi:HlyD family secretion protein